MPRTAREVNRLRWGSYVDMRVDVAELKACKRRGLVYYDARTKKLVLASNARLTGPKTA